VLPTALQFSHQLLKEIIQPGDHVIDATMGNGYDTTFLAEQVGEKGNVYAFDIQFQAISATLEKLSHQNLTSRVTLIQNGHEHLGEYLGKSEKIQAAIFNLGYLPKSDKHIITQPETTIQALDALCPHLAKGGRILLVSYYGHEGGYEKLQRLEEYCQGLPQENFQVLTYRFINQKNQPPILFCIEKKA